MCKKFQIVANNLLDNIILITFMLFALRNTGIILVMSGHTNIP